MKKNNLLTISTFAIFILTFFNIYLINKLTREKILEYSTMLASKITKHVVNGAYEMEDFDMNKEKIYEIIKNEEGEIKTIIYDAMAVNNLLNAITEKVYKLFTNLEYGDVKKLNIRENILTNKQNNYENGIILEIPLGITTDNYLLMNLGPKIPVRISITGELESQISTKVEEYGINNALISMYVDITITEQITMPFISEKIKIDNQIPIAINLINGKIPNYYFESFDKHSNLYQVN